VKELTFIVTEDEVDGGLNARAVGHNLPLDTDKNVCVTNASDKDSRRGRDRQECLSYKRAMLWGYIATAATTHV
jgi:hypothetical protein